MRAAAARFPMPEAWPPDSATELRVGDATLKRTESGLICDCPMAREPACLHRLVTLGRPAGG